MGMCAGPIFIAEQSCKNNLGELGQNGAQLTVPSIHHCVKSAQGQCHTLTGILDLIEVLTCKHAEPIQRDIPFGHTHKEGVYPHRMRHDVLVHPPEQLFDRISLEAAVEVRIRKHGEIPFQYPDLLRQIVRIAANPGQGRLDVVELAGPVCRQDLNRGHRTQIRQRVNEICYGY
jgi:hypothetical protein